MTTTEQELPVQPARPEVRMHFGEVAIVRPKRAHIHSVTTFIESVRFHDHGGMQNAIEFATQRCAEINAQARA